MLTRRRRVGLAAILTIATVLTLTGCTRLQPEDMVAEIDLWVTSQAYDPVRYEIGLLLQEAWQELGFRVKTTIMDWPAMSSRGMKAHEHQAFMCQYGGRPERIDPYFFLYQQYHSSESSPGGYNVAGYENPAYDALAEEFATESDINVRQELAHQMQLILAADVPQPPLVMRTVTMAYNSDEFEDPTMFMGEGLSSFWNWMSLKPKGERTTVRLGYPGDVQNLNPLSTKGGQDMYVLRLIYDPLVRVDVDGVPQPWAAQSVTQIDPTTVEVKLRTGMTFHDGRPVTAEDVKFSFEIAKEVGTAYYSSQLGPLQEVQVLDSTTVRFVLDKPFAPFISNALGVAHILPRHIWQPRYQSGGIEGVTKWNNPNPVGSGPFKFTYWRPAEELKLVANQGHFQPPHISGWLRITYADPQGVNEALKAKELDVGTYSLLPTLLESLEGQPHLTILTVDDLGYYQLHYNCRLEPFDNRDVRRALTMAIPKDKIVDLIFEGQATAGYSAVAPVNTFWHNPDVEKLGNDVKAAKDMLKKAGFRWDKDGLIYMPK